MLSRLASVLFITAVSAVTPVSNDDMNNLLNQGGVDLALQAQPMWLIGQSLNQPPAYPTFAIVNGQQTPASPLCGWPNVGCSARTPGVPIGNPGPSFPVYYSYQKCSDTSIRVAYNLFYQKDGVSPQGVFGHAYDWERVIVIWAQDSSSKNWTPSQVLLSQHSGYQRINWADVQNSFPSSSSGLPRGGPNGIQNQDHLKVYIASYKHDHHQERNTGFNDVLSQLTDNAFRSDDWWYFPKASDYIRSDRSTAIGQQLGSLNWGDASSNPPSVHDSLCSQ